MEDIIKGFSSKLDEDGAEGSVAILVCGICIQKREGNWSRNVSRKYSWDRYGGCAGAGQLLANVFSKILK